MDPDTYTRVAQPCLQVLASVLEPRAAIYVAGPLETGREFYERRAPSASSVRRRNQERMSAFVATLRRQTAAPVIDPGLLRVPNWPSAFYGRFFLAVIDEFAREAWFLDGWEYSRGATSEFVHCASRQIPCRDERGGPLECSHAYALIKRSARCIASLGHDASRFEARLESLDALTRD